MLPMVCYSRRPQSGQITCYFKRTYHVLPTLNTIEIDTDTVEVYAFPPPLEAGTREVADGKQRKPETLTGLWGWIAHRLEVPPWGQALIVVLIATFLAIGSTLWSGFGKLTDINIRLTVIDTRLGLQAGINLIGEVKEYAARGDNALAIQTVENMKSLVAVAKEKKVPPPPGYFARTLTLLDDVKSTEPAVASKLFGARIALTEYHSALEPPPDIPKNLMKIQLEPGTIIPPISVDNRAVYRITDSLQLRRGIHVSSDGAIINALDIPSGTTIFIVPTLPSELPDPYDYRFNHAWRFSSSRRSKVEKRGLFQYAYCVS